MARRYGRAIANARLADVENGRLLVLHVAREIQARLSVPVPGFDPEPGDPFETVRRATSIVAEDFLTIAARCRTAARGPARLESSALLVGAFEALAEAKVACGMLAASFHFDPVAALAADEADSRLREARTQLEALGLGDGSDDAEIERRARIRLLRHASVDLEAVGTAELRRIERLAGNWFLLNSSMNLAVGRRVRGEALLAPLSSRDALNLRRAGAAAATAFAAFRDAPGFLGLLRQVAMYERHLLAARTGSPVFDGSPLSNLVLRIREEVRSGTATLPVLELRSEPGGIAGRFDTGDRPGIAILDDLPTRMSRQYPDAVRVVPLPVDQATLPHIDEARRLGVGLTFRTLGDALACVEIGDPETVRLFFSGEYAVANRIGGGVPEPGGPAPG
ncbi:hypothetical protein BHAOGJBA_4467 [Methylobacterium hispanicum]|uniref:Uncharacterized protein n=2 Tax=Methylobacterium hispanicum TaxID=270350 RepID=A0AAV4ZRN3_9HYPH|nr:hypothetical protein BHAOGJBA_4467 [Methylobacterium hispanicum]